MTIEGLDLDVLATLCLLLSARILPVVVLVPWLSPVAVPLIVRLSVSVGLVVALLPTAIGQDITAEVPLGLRLLRESLVGLVFALAAAAPLLALQWGGELIGTWSRAFDDEAALGISSRPLGGLLLLFGVGVFWLFGMHRLAFLALADGLQAAPLGGPVIVSAVAALGAVRLVADALAFSVAVAGPVLVTLLLYDVAWGLAARAAGPFSSPFVLMPLRSLVVIGAVLLGFTFVVDELAFAFEEAFAIGVRWVAGLVGP